MLSSYPKNNVKKKMVIIEACVILLFSSYSPLQAPADVIQKFSYIADENRRIFAAMLYKLDESVGRVTKALQEHNMLKNSIIVFTTDNGGPAAGFNRNHASNWPLKGVWKSCLGIIVF